MLNILYQDEHFVAIHKPSGLLVHRSMIDRHETRFAVQMLRDQLGQHVYPLHRLDKPTAGVLLFGLSKEAAQRGATLFESGGDGQQKNLHKHYLAIVRGWAPTQVSVDHPLKEELDKMTDRKARQDKPAQSALSHFKRLATVEIDAAIDRYPQSRFSLVACQAVTGRKHQLRRHLKHISHPIIGDAKHGKGNYNRYMARHWDAPGLLLSAVQVSFSHPYSHAPIVIDSPLEQHFQALCQRFDWLDNIAPQWLGGNNRALAPGATQHLQTPENTPNEEN